MATVIRNATELQAMSGDLTADYELGSDINATETAAWNGGLGFVPIGPSGTPFTGSLDGKGHKIINLTVNRVVSDNIGLFGFLDGAIVSNLRVEGTFTGDDVVGGIAGNIDGGTITNCSTNVTVVADSSSGGGFAGLIYGAAVVTDCHSEGTVDEGAAVFTSYGGFAGWIGTSAVITRCYSTVDVTAPNANYVGGFVGYCSETAISQCFTAGDVHGDQYVGGFIGTGAFGNGVTSTIENCYATGAVHGVVDACGFCHSNGNWANCILIMTNCYATGAITCDAGATPAEVAGLFQDENLGTVTVTECFWDTESTGVSNSLYGTGKTTAEMKAIATFQAAGWSISRIWNVLSNCNSGYPCLIDVNICCTVRPSPVDQTILGNKVTLEAIRNLEIVYGGRFYIDKSGNAVYESRYHRST